MAAEYRRDSGRLDRHVALCRVTRGNVTDLVTENVCNFDLGIGDDEETARYIDMAARQGEGVWGVHLDEIEGVVHCATRGA